MRRLAFAAPSATTQPAIVADLNMTPLIDVLLVLIVMFILLVPTMTHEVPIDLPRPAPDVTKPLEHHRVVVAQGGGVTLDGVAVSDAALAARLPAIAGNGQSELTMLTDPEARYERFDQVLAVVKRAGVTRLGFEGNALYAK